MNFTRSPGQIVTFYSYKGGTGRSMALANVAWLLASEGYRVLMADWDLEAPGLHRYFHPFLRDKALGNSEGIIELLTKFESAAILPNTSIAPTPEYVPVKASSPNSNGEERWQKLSVSTGPDWYLPLADISSYCIPIAWPFPDGGRLDLLPSGKQDFSYSARVNAFNWTNFYDRLGGGVFLEAVKDNMRKGYDYVLIDSRTGLSDTSGVCTVQMPDTVVVCFTYNIQSIEGAVAVAASIRSLRESNLASADPLRSFRIYPMPMRVETAEKEQLDRARGFARAAFAGIVRGLPESMRERYWSDIEVPYVPYYAYQEILATIADEPNLTISLLSSFERLKAHVQRVEIVTKPVFLPEGQRRQLKELYLRGARPRKIDEFLSDRPELQDLVYYWTTRQQSWIQSGGRDSYLLDRDDVNKLREDVELSVTMLEDRGFREFLDRSDQAIRLRNVRRIAVAYAMAIVLSIAGLVAASDLVWSKDVASMIRRIASAYCAGTLGAAASFLLAFDIYIRGPQISWVKAMVTLINGGIYGIIMSGILSEFFEIKITNATNILIGFFAGMAGHRLFPQTIVKTLSESVDARPSPPA
jgi:cellulose biosynthesis protein BcsQ